MFVSRDVLHSSLEVKHRWSSHFFERNAKTYQIKCMKGKEGSHSLLIMYNDDDDIYIYILDGDLLNSALLV